MHQYVAFETPNLPALRATVIPFGWCVGKFLVHCAKLPCLYGALALGNFVLEQVLHEFGLGQ